MSRMPHSKKEIGMLMVILAAETVADCCITHETALSTEMMASPGGFLSTTPPGTRLVSMRGGFPSDPTVMVAAIAASSTAGDSDTGMSTPTTNSPTDSMPLSATLDRHTPSSAAAAATAREQLVMDPAAFAAVVGTNAVIIGLVLSFLPWRTALQLRRVSRTWFRASLSVAALLRMPGTGLPAVFVPCDRPLGAEEGPLEHALAPPVDQAASCATSGHERLFLGQLRREATVPMVKWLVEHVCGCLPGSLAAVENHRNRVTLRGKGCAWAYVTPAAAAAIVAFHHRVFYDLVGGVEGCWVVPASEAAALSHEIHVTGYQSNRPRHMPRNGIVCEKPLGAPAHQRSFAAAGGGAAAGGPHETAPHAATQQQQQHQQAPPCYGYACEYADPAAAAAGFDAAYYAHFGNSYMHAQQQQMGAAMPPSYSDTVSSMTYCHNPYATM